MLLNGSVGFAENFLFMHYLLNYSLYVIIFVNNDEGMCFVICALDKHGSAGYL